MTPSMKGIIDFKMERKITPVTFPLYYDTMSYRNTDQHRHQLQTHKSIRHNQYMKLATHCPTEIEDYVDRLTVSMMA